MPLSETLKPILSASLLRGLNEHTNGLIRRFYLKATDFSQVSHRKIAELEYTLNTRGQKSWAIALPIKVFLTHLLAA
ncbi:hypothetical protein EWM60_08890 [Candidatus Erwinia dacicola]|nr:hypothetical protein [Candidatus Erwinia dacicola]